MNTCDLDAGDCLGDNSYMYKVMKNYTNINMAGEVECLLFDKTLNKIARTYTFKANKLVNGSEYLGKNAF